MKLPQEPRYRATVFVNDKPIDSPIFASYTKMLKWCEDTRQRWHDENTAELIARCRPTPITARARRNS
jgi:hypothetical protein